MSVIRLDTLACSAADPAPTFSGTLQPSHHLHLLDSKEGKHHQAYYKRFDLRSVFLLYPCYMDKGNCLSIWQLIR